MPARPAWRLGLCQSFCARGKRGFHERLGFVARPDDAPGMELERR